MGKKNPSTIILLYGVIGIKVYVYISLKYLLIPFSGESTSVFKIQDLTYIWWIETHEPAMVLVWGDGNVGHMIRYVINNMQNIMLMAQCGG